MDTTGLVTLMLEKALRRLWRLHEPRELIEWSEDAPFQFTADFIFSQTGRVRWHSSRVTVADDEIDLSMILWERGLGGQEIVEFQLGLIETDLIKGQLVWVVTVSDVEGMQFNDRAITTWCDLDRVIGHPDFTGPMEPETVARLEALHRNLQASAAAASS